MRWFPRVLVLLVALATAGGAYVGHALSTDAPAELPLGSPAQRVVVAHLVSSLPVPTGATRDVYASACGFPTDYCVVAPGTTRRALLEEVTRLLEGRGARAVEAGCSADERDATWCVGRFVVSGVGLAAVSDDSLGPLSGHGTARLGITLGAPASALAAALDEHAEPLRSLVSVGIRQGHWSNVVCKTTVVGGCVDLRASLSARGAVRPVVETLRAELEQDGFWVDVVNCRPARRGGTSCLLGGRKFRVQGGREGVAAIVRVMQLDASRASVDLRLSPYGW